MNIGQILETHLGWAAKNLGIKIGRMLGESRAAAEIRSFLDQVSTTRAAASPGTSPRSMTGDVVARSPGNLRNGITDGDAGVRQLPEAG